MSARSADADAIGRIERLVVAANGSELSFGAVRWAVDLAGRCDARIDVIDVCEHDDREMDAAESEAHLEAIGTRLEAHLAERNLSVDRVVVERGDLADVIGRHVDGPSDLLVLGAHRSGDRHERRHESLVGAISRSLSSPIVLVPGGDWSDGTQPVLVGVDGSELNRGVFRWAQWLSDVMERHLIAVHISDPIYRTFAGLDQDDPAESSARRQVDHSGAEFVDRVDPDPGASLCEYAEIRSAGLLVVGARVHHSAHGRLIGGVTARVIEEAPCPVVVLPWALRVALS